MLIHPTQKKLLVPLVVAAFFLLLTGLAVLANSSDRFNRGGNRDSAENTPAQPSASPIVQEVIVSSPMVVGTPAPADEVNPKTQGLVRKTGTIICLPKKNTNGPQTMECAFGLKTSEGNYGLNDTDPTYANVSGVEMGVEVEVTGRMKSKKTEDTYDSIGIIDVVKIEKL